MSISLATSQKCLDRIQQHRTHSKCSLNTDIDPYHISSKRPKLKGSAWLVWLPSWSSWHSVEDLLGRLILAICILIISFVSILAYSLYRIFKKNQNSPMKLSHRNSWTNKLHWHTMTWHTGHQNYFGHSGVMLACWSWSKQSTAKTVRYSSTENTKYYFQFSRSVADLMLNIVKVNVSWQ